MNHIILPNPKGYAPSSTIKCNHDLIHGSPSSIRLFSRNFTYRLQKTKLNLVVIVYQTSCIKDTLLLLCVEITLVYSQLYYLKPPQNQDNYKAISQYLQLLLDLAQINNLVFKVVSFNYKFESHAPSLSCDTSCYYYSIQLLLLYPQMIEGCWVFKVVFLQLLFQLYDVLYHSLNYQGRTSG